jgi:hypothetical protein
LSERRSLRNFEPTESSTPLILPVAASRRSGRAPEINNLFHNSCPFIKSQLAARAQGAEKAEMVPTQTMEATMIMIGAPLAVTKLLARKPDRLLKRIPQ